MMNLPVTSGPSWLRQRVGERECRWKARIYAARQRNVTIVSRSHGLRVLGEVRTEGVDVTTLRESVDG